MITRQIDLINLIINYLLSEDVNFNVKLIKTPNSKLLGVGGDRGLTL